MAKSRARSSAPPEDARNPDDETRTIESPSSLDDAALISAATTARATGTDDASLVEELLTRAATKNKSALDRLAR